jgi:hypothetical protein
MGTLVFSIAQVFRLRQKNQGLKGSGESQGFSTLNLTNVADRSDQRAAITDAGTTLRWQ